jgi:beta-mannosidase
MKRILSIVFLHIVIMTTAQTTSGTFLKTSWRFRGMDTLTWMPAAVPGCVHTDLEKNNIIANPLIGINESLCQWVGEKDWVYETLPFDVSEEILSKTIVRLKFHQVDTYATIFFNDKKILETENCFRTYEADVKELLRASGNVLKIEFESPIVKSRALLQQWGYPLPGDPVRAVSRKPQYHFGWDWGPKLVTCGITAPIEWIAYNDAHIQDIYLHQKFVSSKRAEVSIEVTSHQHEKGNWKYTVTFGEAVTKTIEINSVEKGIRQHNIDLSIPSPQLWYCNGQGTPYLYDVRIISEFNGSVVNEQTIKTGLRTIRLVTQPDDAGETFYFELNGQSVFCKGANYIPITMLPALAERKDYEQLIKQCADANFNMLRVWGGGYYERKEFYEICDSLGIMVWQDFMFACSMYPGNDSYLRNVREEAEQQVKRLRNHASIALWCGNNENAEGWQRWGWQIGLSRKEKEKLEKAYSDVFNDLLPNAVLKHHTTINYWESSPRFGRGDKRSFTEGDSHYWGLWHDEEPFELLLDRIPRFMSEFGMQSYPNKATLEEILTTDSINGENSGMLQHQKHPRGKKLMDDYMRRWYSPQSNDLWEYAAYTQRMQADGMCMGIEAQRRHKPYCMGTLFWQLNDVWPAFSWSAIDYKMEPKTFMKQLKEVYANELLSPVVEDDFLRVYYINDGQQRRDIVDVHILLTDSAGTQLYSDTARFVSLEKEGIIYGKKWSEILPNVPLEKIYITCQTQTLTGEIIHTRNKKLVPKDWN